MALPSVGYVRGTPQLVRHSSVSRAGNRVISVVEWADPYWSIEVETAPLYLADQRLLNAFEAEYGAGTKTLLWTSPGLAVPILYEGDQSNAALSNDGNLVSVTGGTSLSINSVTTGLALKRGDLISLATGDYRSLHTVMADATASGSAVTLVVQPFVPGYITAGAVVKFKNPEMKVRMLPGSFQMGDDYLAAASFTLVEVPK